MVRLKDKFCDCILGFGASGFHGETRISMIIGFGLQNMEGFRQTEVAGKAGEIQQDISLGRVFVKNGGWGGKLDCYLYSGCGSINGTHLSSVPARFKKFTYAKTASTKLFSRVSYYLRYPPLTNPHIPSTYTLTLYDATPHLTSTSPAHQHPHMRPSSSSTAAALLPPPSLATFSP